VGIRLAKLPEMLLEGALPCCANAVELAWRQAGIELLSGPGNRLLIDGFDVLSPEAQCRCENGDIHHSGLWVWRRSRYTR
jgi:hypothetical protein